MFFVLNRVVVLPRIGGTRTKYKEQSTKFQVPSTSDYGLRTTDQLVFMLHILNGSSTEGTLKQSSVTGEYFSFRDALINGPTPGEVHGEKWRLLRARHLSESYGVDLAVCERDLTAQEATLSSFLQHEEVVLWFEHDLFCQLNLLYLLDWFAHVELAQTRLTLINIGEFAGRDNFRGLGELNASELASLFPQRHEVTAGELALATSAWAAYRSFDPTNIQVLLETDTSSLPFLKSAFKAHLQRFPSTRNGLGRIEHTGLSLIENGSEKFIDLFQKFAAAEPVYGLGDAQLWLNLLELSTAREPLLSIQNGNGSALTPRVIHSARFKLTAVGRALLTDGADFVELNGIELWLGGTHLQNEVNVWRWNEEKEKLERSK